MTLTREQIEGRRATAVRGVARIDKDGGPRHSMEKETYDWWKADIALCDMALRGLELEARIARVEDALNWYGENSRLCRLIHSEGDKGRNALADDGGKRARNAVEGK